MLWLFLTAVLMGVVEFYLPVRRPDGLYPSTDRMPLGVIATALAAWLANEIVSRAFRAARLSDERWSVFARRR